MINLCNFDKHYPQLHCDITSIQTHCNGFSCRQTSGRYGQGYCRSGDVSPRQLRTYVLEERITGRGNLIKVSEGVITCLYLCYVHKQVSSPVACIYTYVYIYI